MKKLKVILPVSLSLGVISSITPIIACYCLSKQQPIYKFVGNDDIKTKTGARECFVLENNKILCDITFTTYDNEFWFVDNVLCWDIKQNTNKPIKIYVLNNLQELLEVEVNINV